MESGRGDGHLHIWSVMVEPFSSAVQFSLNDRQPGRFYRVLGLEDVTLTGFERQVSA